jgi:hypothetical protein
MDSHETGYPAQIEACVSYLFGFYTDTRPDIFDDLPPSVDEIQSATTAMLNGYALADSVHPLGGQRAPEFDGDSHDREIVRDIILTWRGAQAVEHGDVVRQVAQAASN